MSHEPLVFEVGDIVEIVCDSFTWVSKGEKHKVSWVSHDKIHIRLEGIQVNWVANDPRMFKKVSSYSHSDFVDTDEMWKITTEIAGRS